jgi:type II secretory pathway component PulL
MKFPEIELRHYLPQQMKLGSLQTQFLTTLTQTANQVTTATLSANTIVNLLLQGALN